MTTHRAALVVVSALLVIACASGHTSPRAEPVTEGADRDAATLDPEVLDASSSSSSSSTSTSTSVAEPVGGAPDAAPACTPDIGDVDARWQSVRPLLLRCSAHHAAGTKAVSIGFVISTSGDTTEVDVHGAPEALARCLRGIVATLHFCPGRHPIKVSRFVNE